MHIDTQRTTLVATRKAIARLRIAVALASVIILTACGSARPSTIHIDAPSHARAGLTYTLTVTGSAAEKERLYVFADPAPCGDNPAVEDSRTRGSVYRGSVLGTFTAAVRVIETRAGRINVCAYLQAFSERVNGQNGVLAHAFTSYELAQG